MTLAVFRRPRRQLHLRSFVVGLDAVRVHGADRRELDVRRDATLPFRRLAFRAGRRQAREVALAALRIAAAAAPRLDRTQDALGDEEEIDPAEYGRRPMEIPAERGRESLRQG